jgi:hypothetical protein
MTLMLLAPVPASAGTVEAELTVVGGDTLSGQKMASHYLLKSAVRWRTSVQDNMPVL